MVYSDLIAASSALPGVIPPITIHRRRYIDGCINSEINSDLAKGYDQVLILITENRKNMAASEISDPLHCATFDEEVAELKKTGAQVLVITADEASTEARGPNPLDANKFQASVKAGRAQGYVLFFSFGAKLIQGDGGQNRSFVKGTELLTSFYFKSTLSILYAID